MTELRNLSADVVVVGTGPGGMAAVAAAADAGVSVVAIEAMEHIGGNAVWSTGYMAFVGSSFQDEVGINDSVEKFMDDSKAIVDPVRERYGIDWDEDLTALFAAESGETFRQLTERGVRFSRIIPRPKQHTTGRMLSVEDTWMLQRAYEPDFAKPNVTTLFGTKAERLVIEGGRVTGVVVRRGEETATVSATNGVILATGGYQANPKLRRRYQPEFLADGPYLGVDTCRGDGHLMGQAAGGDLVNMTYVPPLVMVSSSLVEDVIAVNPSGKRFHDEAGPYDDRVDALWQEPGRVGWYIVDARIAEKKSDLIAQMPKPAVVADTLAELAEKIGVPDEALTKTVAEWNAFLAGAATKDPAFGRVVIPAGRQGIEQGPFSAIPMIVGVNFVSGGFVTTKSMEVCDIHGDVIPGLYAAGDCAGGLNPTADLGGIRIAGGLTLGRVAGTAAAKQIEAAPPQFSAFDAYSPSSVNTKLELFHLAGQS